MLIFYRYFDLYTTAGNPPAFFDIVGIFKSPIYKNSVGQQTDTPNDTTTPLRLCGSILYQITNLNFIHGVALVALFDAVDTDYFGKNTGDFGRCIELALAFPLSVAK